MPREVISVVGGPLDGLIGDIHPASSKVGVFVHQENEAVWIYADHHEKDRLGRRIFKPGVPHDK